MKRAFEVCELIAMALLASILFPIMALYEANASKREAMKLLKGQQQ